MRPTLLATLLLTLPLPAQLPTKPQDPALDITSLALWPAANPASAQTSLTVFPPQPGKSNGTAVLVAPGGGYLGLAANLEGRQVADWFAARGITAFVLQYRLGPANPYPAPLLDAQRALRLIRSQAAHFHIDPNRLGIIGFSAGGHLAAETAVSFHTPNPTAADSLDHVSDRPDFLILGYAWLNAMQPQNPATPNFITYCSVMPTLPKTDCRAWQTAYTPALHVTPRTPTTFLYATTDDHTVPATASITFYQALLAAGVPAELHIFRHGGHGSGLGEGDPSLDQWPNLLENWLRAQNLLPPKTP